MTGRRVNISWKLSLTVTIGIISSTHCKNVPLTEMALWNYSLENVKLYTFILSEENLKPLIHYQFTDNERWSFCINNNRFAAKVKVLSQWQCKGVLCQLLKSKNTVTIRRLLAHKTDDHSCAHLRSKEEDIYQWGWRIFQNLHSNLS